MPVSAATTATTRYHRDFTSHNYNAGTLVTVLAVRLHAGMKVATVRFPYGETTTMRTNELVH